MDVCNIRKNLNSGKISVEDLLTMKKEINQEKERLSNRKILTDKEFAELHDLIMIYMDYYVYSEDGDSLISDNQYDLLMRQYIRNGGELLTKCDNLKSISSQWKFVKHESPGMVGSIKKIYEFDELCVYLNKYRTMSGSRQYRIAPKFDGISSAIKINYDGRVLRGVTRNDGIEGQDITEVIRRAENIKNICSHYSSKLHDGESVWIKTELIVTTENFVKLIEEKPYKNRRSATSGIINSPKNLNLARYITIIPLAAHFIMSDEIEYVPLDSRIVSVHNPYIMMDEITTMLSKIRDSHYPIRTDGVVIYPLGEDIIPNYNDIMDQAIAYKVNTEEGVTTIEYGYVSIGRLGNAIPMVKVFPVEVNETTVTDVSLGSFDKFVNMDIHEGEQVVVYSAGNVIPQIKLPEQRHYKENSPLIQIPMKCPYCGEKLERYKNSYSCKNMKCTRVKSGRISNFIIKLNAENVSDRTIEDLYTRGLIKDIPDLFSLTIDQLKDLPGYGLDSAKNIIDEITKIRDTEIPVSSFIGALGINGISEKKCRKIFKVMPLSKMMKLNRNELIFALIDADNTGEKTAQVFSDFITENKSLIKTLMELMTIVNDKSWRGNVVFTGIRYPDLEKKFEDLGYETSNNVNSETIVVIDSSYEHESTKCKAAKKKGITIVHVSDVDDVFDELRKDRY